MTTEPIKAADLDKEDRRTEDERRRQQARHTVDRILTKREALRRSGADIAQSNTALADNIDERLRAKDRENYERFRQRKAEGA
jgi:hypothetical protein